MKNFIAAALLISSLYTTAQSPVTSPSLNDPEHADGALVDPTIKKQKMEESDREKRKIKDLKKEKERKKIDSSSNPIDTIN